MKKILFVTSHSKDIRVKKFIETITKYSIVHFLGYGDIINYYDDKIKICNYTIYNRKIAVFLNFMILPILLFKYNYKKIIVVNDSLFFFYLPILFFVRNKVIIDNHDSMIFKQNSRLLKKLYTVINKMVPSNIITDENRQDYLKRYKMDNLLVIPNVPNIASEDIQKIESDKFSSIDKSKVNILIAGAISKNRGINEAIELSICGNINVYAAGIIHSENDLEMINNSNIKMLGYLDTKEYYFLLNNYIDYLICIYYPINDNQIYASPNKIYDAIIFDSKVIINDDIVVSKFVQDNNLGLVFRKGIKYDCNNFMKYVNDNKLDKSLYHWKNYESVIKKLIN